MADSLREPWICKYLIETGENYGGRLMDVPLRDKKRKVQLVEVRNVYIVDIFIAKCVLE